MKRLSLLTILLTILFFSCKKSDQISDETLTKQDESVYQYIKKLGFKDAEIKDIGEEYLVDGDLLFAKNIQPDFSIFQNGPKTKQYGTNYYVGYSIQPNITIRIDPSMSSYAAEINGAIDIWNDVPNCRINFSLTNATSQDILITNANLGPGGCGAAQFPVNGRPGGVVQINSSVISGNSFDQRQRTIAHELGHAIGFRHTNWTAWGEPESAYQPDNGAMAAAQHILGTPTGGDPLSLMNGRECGTGATALSTYDILAVQFLYPENPPVAGTVPVFRYIHEGYPDPRHTDHFFTTSFSELGDGTSQYKFEGIAFFAFPTQEPGTVPVYRYVNNGGFLNHYYTVTSGSYSGYLYESIGWYAYPSAINSSVPVYRYFSSNNHDHHYTKNPSESSWIGTSYLFERIEFYAY